MDASGSGLVDKQHEVVVFIKVSRIDDSNLDQIKVRDHIKKSWTLWKLETHHD